MPNNRSSISGRYYNGPTLASVDFTAQTVGGMATLPSNLLCARSSTTDTVQTSDTTVSVRLGANVGRIGQRTSSSSTRGLVIEESRVNRLNATELVNLWASASFTGNRTTNYAAAPDGQITADRAQWTGTVGYNGLYADTLNAGTPATTYQASIWIKHLWVGGDALQLQSPTNGTGTLNTDSTQSSWQRYVTSATSGAGGESFIAIRANSTLLPDVLAWGVQSEEAAFATEYIPNDINPPTTGTATRAGERIYTLTTSDWLNSSRLGLYVKLQPKGSSSQYTANMRLWTIDASNYCEIDKTTRLITMVIGGNSFVGSEALSWAANDTVEVWTEGGGTTIQSVMAYRVNGGTTIRLGTSNGAMGNVSATSLDFCCNGTSNQLTSRINQLSAYRAGSRPSWVG